MNILLGNIGTIFSNIINWLGQTASSLITNPIFIVFIAVIIFRILYYSVRLIILELKIKKSYSKEVQKYDDWEETYKNKLLGR